MRVSPSVDEILRSRALRLEFQPVVDLATRGVVGFEALMRGPEGPLGSPEALIVTAQNEGVLEELDRVSRFTALYAASQEPLAPSQLLFLNSECSADPVRFDTELEILDEMVPGIQLVLELTERAVRDNESLCSPVAVARAHGWLVALDDVGSEHAPASLLSRLRPDFVKLDRSVVQEPRTPRTTRTLRTVADYVGESEATVIAEGIENMPHLRTALAVGAHWGQGWMFGRPGPLSAQLP